MTDADRAALKAKPLAVDLFCGLGGWTEGLLAEGYRVVGFDIERHCYGDAKYPAQLVLQDMLTIHGSQFKSAALIVASPPCQAYSYRAMPWKRAKALPPPDNKLFDVCFLIQQQAIEATQQTCRSCGGDGITRGLCRCEVCDGRGWTQRYIPLIVENVGAAQAYVGQSRWHYGSFHLWGDVPALMPITIGRDGRKQPGLAGLRKNGKGDGWFQDGAARHGSKSSARKAASAHIAKIPLPLAQWVARSWRVHD